MGDALCDRDDERRLGRSPVKWPVDRGPLLLAACRESRNPDLVELGLFTGLRQSKALEPTWDRVDRAIDVTLLERRTRA